MKNFAITGVGGYIAPRHLKAIKETGNQLVASVDPHDSVGRLDQFSPDVSFFTEYERFDRHLELLKRGPEESRIHYVSICSPNHLHDAHCRQAMRIGADVICEKPLVLNPWNLDQLQEIEIETGQQINTVLQLRLHPKLLQLRKKLHQEPGNQQHEVKVTNISARGKWYHYSWKGDVTKSGGVATNIGIHLFDMLIWLFGNVVESRVYCADNYRVSGFLRLERACVPWFLSIDHHDLPFELEPGGRTTFRSIIIDGEELEFSEGFADLHTRVYEEVLAGRGIRLPEVRPSIDLAYQVRNTKVARIDDYTHEYAVKYCR